MLLGYFVNSVIHSWLLLEKETQSEACSNIGAPVWRTDGLSEPSCEDPGPVRPDSRQWTLNKSRVNITSVDLRHLKWCEATKKGRWQYCPTAGAISDFEHCCHPRVSGETAWIWFLLWREYKRWYMGLRGAGWGEIVKICCYCPTIRKYLDSHQWGSDCQWGLTCGRTEGYEPCV